MRKFTKEWLVRQRGTPRTRPKPFPRTPTRVGYFTRNWNYIGKPDKAAYQRFRNITQRTTAAPYVVVEFDRGGVFRRYGYGAQSTIPNFSVSALLTYYYVDIEPGYEYPGQFTLRPFGVHRVAKHYVYSVIPQGGRVGLIFRTRHAGFLADQGWEAL